MRLSAVMMGLLLVAGTAGCGEAADRSAPAGKQAALHPALRKASLANAGKAAPAGAFQDAKGAGETLAKYRGRPVLLNLWATWCAPCVAEMPALDRLQGRAGDRLVVLPVSQDLAGWRAVNGFARPGRFKNLPFRVDKENNLALALKASGLPVTVLYDAAGREVWRVAGPVEWDLIPAKVLAP